MTLPSIHTLKEIQKTHKETKLRERFSTALQKLQTHSTKQVALQEISQLIINHISNCYLKIFIQCLQNVPRIQGQNKISRELQVSVIGEIAKIYGEKDILDPPPVNPFKSLLKLFEIARTYLSDNYDEVQISAANALCDLYEYCLPKHDIQILLAFVLNPLVNDIQGGGDTIGQNGSAKALNA